MAIDRRFLNISISVVGIANEPPDNPTNGTQYIVGATPTGAFAGATPNSIARYNGSAWKFSAPKIGGLEVLNADTGELLNFNGSTWGAVAAFGGSDNFIKPVLNILNSGSTLPQSPIQGDTFFNSSDGKIYSANTNNTWDNGTDTTNGSRYASANEFKIFVNDNGTLSALNIIDGAFFLNKADNSLYVYNASVPALIKISASSSDTDEIVTEHHSLSAEEVNAKAFTLSHYIKSGKENSVLLFASGIAQIEGTDFTASGNSISWTGKALDDVDLSDGDIFVIQYSKS